MNAGRLIPIALLATLVLAGSARADLDNLVWLEAPEPAADDIFQDAVGAPKRLADFEGRVVLLNFWATWCAPCLREMPSLDRLQGRLGDDDFVVLAVSEDRGGIADAKPFFEEVGIAHLELYADPAMDLARGFRVVGLPSTYVIDHRGRTVARLLGDAEWDSEQAIALLEPLIAAAREARGTTGLLDAPCRCGGPKADRVARYGTVAPPPED